VNLPLDTHVLLWWDSRDKTLNADTRAVIADPGSQVFFSAASIWEIAIKCRLKKPDFRGFAVAAIGANGFHKLLFLPIDAKNTGALAWRHNDPFDRMLVAQARPHLHPGNRRRGDPRLPERCPDVGRLTSAPLPD
jgi:PIN domain nuclease of toxin-antitoxin system